MVTSHSNMDPFEIDKFAKLANGWWTPKGPMRGLHDINPVRIKYMESQVSFDGKTILDIGCGAGILAESLAKKGARVTGLDMNKAALNIARLHGETSGCSIEYLVGSAESLVEEGRRIFDIVACMEVLEHVPFPHSLVRACRNLVKPGGHVFFATLNRTRMATFLAVSVAERLLKIVAKGTHDPKRFIKPDELTAWAEEAGLVKQNLSGVRYIPFGPICYLTRDTSVNYMMHFVLK